ncbi:MAG: nucleotidyltransferase domain-containing protein [Myxococcota bacterium]
MLSPHVVTQITEILDQRFGLDTLYVFGSTATGRARADSDIDLAILARRRPEGLEMIDVREDLAARLGQPVDLVLLDQVSPVIAMQVLAHGERLIDRNPRRRAEVEARVLSTYADLKRVRAPIEEAIRARHAHG